MIDFTITTDIMCSAHTEPSLTPAHNCEQYVGVSGQRMMRSLARRVAKEDGWVFSRLPNQHEIAVCRPCAKLNGLEPR